MFTMGVSVEEHDYGLVARQCLVPLTLKCLRPKRSHSMKITGNDHSTRRRTNLLQDGIGRHFGISRWELGSGPVRNPKLAKDCRRRGHGNTIT